MKNLLVNPITSTQVENYIVRPAHSLILSGHSGSGKNKLALGLIDKLLGAGYQPSQVLVVDGQDEATIEEIRKIDNFIKLIIPGDKKIKRVVYIKSLDLFGQEAQNALLKTFEEPPEDTIFISTSGDISRILLTVMSRSQEIMVLPVELSQAKRYFVNFPQKDVEKAYFIANGAAETIRSILVGDDDGILRESIEWAKKIAGMSKYQRLCGIDSFLKNTTKDQIDIYLASFANVLKAGILYSKENDKAREAYLISSIAAVNEARESLRRNSQPKLTMTNLFMSM